MRGFQAFVWCAFFFSPCSLVVRARVCSVCSVLVNATCGVAGVVGFREVIGTGKEV